MATVGLRKAARTDNQTDPLQAPVCHVAPTAVIPEGAAPTLPAIPVPTGAAPWVGALIHGYNALSGNTPQGGGGVSGGLSGFTTKKKSPTQDTKVGRYVEQSRKTKKVRVTNPDDDQQYVDVEVIVALTMVDTVTGETWVWTR